MTTISRPMVISANGPSFWVFANPYTFVRTMVGHRDLICQFVKRDLRSRTRDTHLGIFWDLLNPLLMLLVYTLVFNSILRMRLSGKGGEGPLEFAMYLFAGLTAFQLFAEPLTKSATLITSKRNFVKKMAFPLEIFAIVVVATTAVHTLIGFVLVILAGLLLQGSIPPTTLLLPVVLIPAILMAVSAGWALGALGVYFRDLKILLGNTISRLLFFMTPIFYSIDAVPPHLRWILHLNPLTGVVTDVRRVLLDGVQPDWRIWGVWSVVGCFSMILSYALFMRVRRGFADVI